MGINQCPSRGLKLALSILSFERDLAMTHWGAMLNALGCGNLV